MTDQPATITTLTKQDLKDLAELRRDEARIGKEILDLTEKLNNTPEAKAVQEAMDKRKKVSEDAYILEQFIRKSALDDFINTKVMPAFAGVKVKVFRVLKYELGEAEKWAKEKMPELFKFDTKGFEKYAKAVEDTIPVPCVKFDDDPRVEIATDLSLYLL